METVRVGFIGTGRISDLHAIEYIHNPFTKIVALCDRQVELAERRCRAWNLAGATVLADYRELLSLPEIDLVEIFCFPIIFTWKRHWLRSRPARQSRSKNPCARRLRMRTC